MGWHEIKLLIALLTITLQADILIPITSRHYSTDHAQKEPNFVHEFSGRHDYNNKNIGVILIDKQGYKAGVYKNSEYHTSVIIGKDTYFNEHFGYSLNIATGYAIPIAPVVSLFAKYKMIRFDIAPIKLLL